MIVILSYPGDQVANSVMDWLAAYKCNYRRIHLEEEDFRKLAFSIAMEHLNIQFELSNGDVLKMEEVSMFFFRGGLLKLNLNDYKCKDLPDALMERHLLHEFNTVVRFFYKQIAKKCLGNPLLHPLNKLEQLETARELGLKIPVSIIHNSRKGLKTSLLKALPVFITKSIQENVLYQETPGIHYDLKVHELEMKEVSDSFFPSLFQEGIEKSLEIRAFYLDGSFYSIAMLLCASDQRVVDYRLATNSIRYATYQLPEGIKTALEKLMKRMGLTSGSIDLMLASNGDYYFLEVNPTGQIGWVSDFGNYCLEEKIAQYLLKKEKVFIYERTTTPAG
jgi:hypothetical protein